MSLAKESVPQKRDRDKALNTLRYPVFTWGYKFSTCNKSSESLCPRMGAFGASKDLGTLSPKSYISKMPSGTGAIALGPCLIPVHLEPSGAFSTQCRNQY